jgi:hypothetical protein
MATGQKLRGLVGQGMNGRRNRAMQLAAVPVVATSGSGVVTARRACVALIFAWAPGGSGGSDGSGAGGGAALFKRVYLPRGAALSYSIGAPGAGVSSSSNGNDGGDTTVTLPSGQVLTAGGGKAGTVADPAAGGLGGVATGGDINRRGGDGGRYQSGSLGLSGSPGQGAGAGAGGAANSNRGGGGGGAGLADLLSDLIGGGGSDASGVSSAAGSAPGGGSGGGQSASGNGGAGKVIIVLIDKPT